MEIRRRPPNPKVKVANLEYAIPHNEGEPRNILEKIVWEKDREINLARNRIPLEKLKSKISELPEPKNFFHKIKTQTKLPAVIAEIKKASPSKGVIREDFEPTYIARAYKEAGATCLSVLTDKTFFQGGFDILTQVREVVDLPILCKDFILEPYQIYQARSAGADAILLIAAILSDQDLIYLRKIALKLEMTVLVEVHNIDELKRILDLDLFRLIGINNRDLKTFQTDIHTTARLISAFSKELIKKDVLIVSESGLFNRKDLDMVLGFGAKAVLVGEALMRNENIKLALNNLIGE